MDGKRVHIVQGNTPSKPSGRKRTRICEETPAASPNSNARARLFCPTRSPSRTPSKNQGNLPRRVVIKPKSPFSFIKSPVRHHKWSRDEDKALIEFVGFSKMDPEYWVNCDKIPEWPAFRYHNKYWEEAAKYIKTSTSSSILLTNMRVRGRLLNTLKQEFQSFEGAEEHFKLSLSDYLESMELASSSQSKRRSIHTNTEPIANIVDDIADTLVGATELSAPARLTLNTFANVISAKNIVQMIEFLITLLTYDETLNVADLLWTKLFNLNNINSNPGNYISLSLHAMFLLQNSNKSNLLFKFAYCIATKRPESDEPLFPLNRMPFGLVEYQIEFFSCTNISQIKMPEDFASWHQTLCSEFPTRLNRLFRGPMWSGVPKQQQGSPLTARVNVAAVSTRTVDKEIAKSEFSTDPIIQIPALKEMKAAHPTGRFWIKGDGCDCKAALQESVKGLWNGDVDLEDGKLKVLRMEYEGRRNEYDQLLKDDDRDEVERKLRVMDTELEGDRCFLSAGLVKADEEYRRKFDSPNTARTTLMALCWERVEFNTLLQQSQALKMYTENMMTFLNPENPQVIQVLGQFREKKGDWLKYLRNVYVKKRQPAATHVFVFLISEEQRNRKPYCMPIQYLPYHSLKDQHVRDLSMKVKEQMTALGMTTVGFVSDGEFNSLRTQGEKRPTHLWQIIHDARESVSRQRQQTLLQFLIKVGDDEDGNPLTERRDEAVPLVIINFLYNLQHNAGVTLLDAVKAVRTSLLPPGFVPSPFRANTEECFVDMLRSIIATFRFRHTIQHYKAQGVDFCSYLYIPEIDEATSEPFHEREDHCHILKRIWKHTREEGPDGTNLQAFDEAMLDPNTGLTHAALTGERKQSVQDAERMLSYLVADFLTEHGYQQEGEYVKTVAGWHEAADGRGLSELDRSKKNYAMLNMILDDWMPWHRTNYDFSTIDINRPVKGICGFSRETVIAVTTNVESMEYRRRDSHRIGYLEHPRAGTSDDVEAFISLLHRFLGNIFTVKDLKSRWRKIVREYCKRISVDLPFYYWTSNERFRDQDDELPSFNEAPEFEEDVNPSEHPLRLHRLTLNRREDSAIFVAGRSFLPARNQTTVRHRIHRPVVHPPVPDIM